MTTARTSLANALPELPVWLARVRSSSRTALVVATCWGLGACGSAASTAPDAVVADRALTGLGTGEPRLKDDGVFVLAAITEEFRPSQRGWMDRLARALRVGEPDLVLVWVPASAVGEEEVAEPWGGIRPEVAAVVLPWAREHGVSVEGVSAESERSLADADAFYQEYPIGPPARMYLAARGAYHARVLGQSPEDDPAWVYGEEHDLLAERHVRWLAYYAEEALGAAGPLGLLSAGAGTMEDLVREAEGLRVAVVVPQDAMWFVEAALRSAFPERFEEGADHVY